jgi:putative oxygen-independent coproporphyrinogen III oxidase
MSKCYYCDFNSYSGRENIQDEYVDCIIREMKMRSRVFKENKIGSVFIGGGTPTYLNLNAMARLTDFLSGYISPETEYTWEANPGTLTPEKLRVLKNGGVNRLSIGLQSWSDEILKKIGRIHTLQDFLINYNEARKIGFNNINIDIMFSIQGQTIQLLDDTLTNVISLNPEHISCYGLIIEEGTPFGDWVKDGKLTEVDEDTDREMYYLANRKLEGAGYKRYEISNFAKPKYECRHNITYWRTDDYIGIGAGAHSLLNGMRFSNELLPEAYIKRIKDNEFPVCWEEQLTLKDRISEFMFMGLRMNEGISTAEFRLRFGIDIMEVYGRQIEQLKDKKLLYGDGERLVLTDFGVDISNQVFVEFV